MAAPPDAGFISIEEVHKDYDSKEHLVTALDGVSLNIRRSEFVSILGPSGCGKSTLIMIIAGLVPATSGRVRIDGSTVQGPLTNIGIVFQRPVLLDWRTNLANVMLQVEAHDLDRDIYRKKAMDLFEAVGLAGFEDRRPFELSGGMQQRVSLCRALVHEPELLLMDEPFGALDALTRSQMSLDLQRMWLDRPITVVFVTHSIQEAVFLSDRVVVLSPRPGTIDDVIEIDLARPRRLEDQRSAKIQEYVDKIEAIFRARGVLRE